MTHPLLVFIRIISNVLLVYPSKQGHQIGVPVDGNLVRSIAADVILVGFIWNIGSIGWYEFCIFQWVNQELLGTPDAGKLPMKEFKESLKKKCDEDIQELTTSSFHSIFGNSAQDFHWGSNSESCLGRGIAQMYEYALTKDSKYRQAALST